MSDANLLTFGCAMFFIAAAGAYVALRERYLVRVREWRQGRAPKEAARE